MEQDIDLPLLNPKKVFPKDEDDAMMSGDSKEFPRDPYNSLRNVVVPLLEDDEQLQLVTAFPSGKEARQVQTMATTIPLWGGEDRDPSPEPSNTSFPDNDKQLNMVDQAPTDEAKHHNTEKTSTTQELANASPNPVESLSLVKAGLAREEVTDVIHTTWLASHGKVLPSLQQPSPKTHVSKEDPVGLTLTPHGEHTIDATSAASPSIPEMTRKNIYTGLNGRYFQRQQEAPSVNGELDSRTLLTTTLPVLTLALQKIVDNSIETPAGAVPSPASVVGGRGSYTLSNEVEGNSKSIWQSIFIYAY